MIWIGVIVLILAILFLWFYYDMHLAKRDVHNRSYPMRKGDVTLYTDGQALFDDFFQQMTLATNKIDIIFYIVKNDWFSQEFVGILKKKARDGVQVRLLLDWIGAWRLPRKVVKEMEESGVQVRFSYRPKFPNLFWTIMRRNHQKIAVFDNKVAYLGGFNIANEYVNEHETLTPWRDYHVKLIGEIALDFEREFNDVWTGKTTKIPPVGSTDGDIQLVPYEVGQLEKQYLAYIGSAQERVLIGTPYFIPCENIFKALLTTLQRGVKVEIIVPTKQDHVLVRDASFPYLKALLDQGALIHQFNAGFYHAKFIAIDTQLIEITTANFDMRSFFINDEVACKFTNPDTIANMLAQIQLDIAASTLMTPEQLRTLTFGQKIKAWPAKILAPYL